MNEKYYYMQKMLDFVLRLANAIDENKGYEGLNFRAIFYTGYRAFTDYMRMGVKEVINLQMEYYREKEHAEIAKVGEDEAREFLESVFGDADIVTISDGLKDEIRAFIEELGKVEGSDD